MRLLETLQDQQPLGGFVNFEGDNVPDYAILSHTWEKEEVTLQHVLDPQTDIKLLAGYAKIKGACRLALSQGYEYIWIDTCCIDKTSSVELSEAINSMFNWYEQAGVCYVFLSDLAPAPHGSGLKPSEMEPMLRECRWFTRGWTLQELIAPDNVDFYDQTWQLVGSKLDEQFAPVLSNVTRINPDVLSKSMPLESTSVAERMHWASSRVTTRKEDMAYCLMGIFGVNMPLLYGEGMRAFTRLQEAVLQETGDHSIFAWHSNYETSTQEAALDQHILSGLLAPSPAEFSQVEQFRPLPAFGTSISQPVQLTSQGVRVSFYLEPVTEPGYVAEDFYAVLDCAIHRNDGDHCPRIMLRRLARGQYARIRTGSACSTIPALDSTALAKGGYQTVFVKRDPAYVMPDVSLLKLGWKSTDTRTGWEAYAVADYFPPGPWVPSLRILRPGNPYFEPVLAALRFQSPSNPQVQVDVAVGWRKGEGEWKLWCHACEAQDGLWGREDLGVDVLYRDLGFAVTGGYEHFSNTNMVVPLSALVDGMKGRPQFVSEVLVEVRLVEVDRLGRKGVRIECGAPPQPYIAGFHGITR